MDAKRAPQPDWATVRYMISCIQYAGRITDDYDRVLMVCGAGRVLLRETVWGAVAGWAGRYVLWGGCGRGRCGVLWGWMGDCLGCWLQWVRCRGLLTPPAPTLPYPHLTQPTALPYTQDTYAERFYHADALLPGAALFRDERSGASGYCVPQGSDVEVFRGAIEELPATDSPELFGLHSNADLTFRTLQVGG